MKNRILLFSFSLFTFGCLKAVDLSISPGTRQYEIQAARQALGPGGERKVESRFLLTESVTQKPNGDLKILWSFSDFKPIQSDGTTPLVIQGTEAILNGFEIVLEGSNASLQPTNLSDIKIRMGKILDSLSQVISKGDDSIKAVTYQQLSRDFSPAGFVEARVFRIMEILYAPLGREVSQGESWIEASKIRGPIPSMPLPAKSQFHYQDHKIRWIRKLHEDSLQSMAKKMASSVSGGDTLLAKRVLPTFQSLRIVDECEFELSKDDNQIQKLRWVRSLKGTPSKGSEVLILTRR